MEKVNESEIDQSLVDAFTLDSNTFGIGFYDFVLNNKEVKVRYPEYNMQKHLMNTSSLFHPERENEIKSIKLASGENRDFDSFMKTFNSLIGKNVVIQPVTVIRQKSIVFGNNPPDYPVLEVGNLLDEFRTDGEYLFDLTNVIGKKYSLKGDIPIDSVNANAQFKNISFLVEEEANSILLGFATPVQKD